MIKHKSILMVVFSLAACGAQAEDGAYTTLININPTGPNSSLQSVANANTSTSNSFGGDNSATAAGGAGGVGQGGAASQSYNVEAIRQSPAVFMNAPAPTAPCQATAGGFVSFIAGGGFAASYTLEECELRESARIAHGIGETAMAKQIMCMGKFAKLTASCKGE